MQYTALTDEPSGTVRVASRTRAALWLVLLLVLLGGAGFAQHAYVATRNTCEPPVFHVVASVTAHVYPGLPCDTATSAAPAWQVATCLSDPAGKLGNITDCPVNDRCYAAMCKDCFHDQHVELIGTSSSIQPGSRFRGVCRAQPDVCTRDVPDGGYTEIEESCKAQGSPVVYDPGVEWPVDARRQISVVYVSASLMGVAALVLALVLLDYRKSSMAQDTVRQAIARSGMYTPETIDAGDAMLEPGVARPRDVPAYQSIVAWCVIVGVFGYGFAALFASILFTACNGEASVDDGGVDQFYAAVGFVAMLCLLPACMSVVCPTPREAWYKLNPQAEQQRDQLKEQANEQGVPWQEPDEPVIKFSAPPGMPTVAFATATLITAIGVLMLTGHQSCPTGLVSFGLTITGAFWFLIVAAAWAKGHLINLHRMVMLALVAVFFVMAALTGRCPDGCERCPDIIGDGCADACTCCQGSRSKDEGDPQQV